MVCLPRFISALGFFAFALGAVAQETPVSKTEVSAVLPSPTPAPAAPAATTTTSGLSSMPASRQRERAISKDLAKTLAQGMPKYDPPKPVEKKLDDEDLPDMRDIDKPRNEIIRLPKVVVEGSRPPVFTKRDIMTPDAFRAMLAKKYYSEQYLAFNRFTQYTPLRFLLPSAEDSAMAQYYEEQRLQGMGTMSEAANTAAKLGDKTESDYIKRTSNETYMSRSDFGWHNPNK
jgi:hypothetical protein